MRREKDTVHFEQDNKLVSVFRYKEFLQDAGLVRDCAVVHGETNNTDEWEKKMRIRFSELVDVIWW